MNESTGTLPHSRSFPLELYDSLFYYYIIIFTIIVIHCFSLLLLLLALGTRKPHFTLSVHNIFCCFFPLKWLDSDSSSLQGAHNTLYKRSGDHDGKNTNSFDVSSTTDSLKVCLHKNPNIDGDNIFVHTDTHANGAVRAALGDDGKLRKSPHTTRRHCFFVYNRTDWGKRKMKNTHPHSLTSLRTLLLRAGGRSGQLALTYQHRRRSATTDDDGGPRRWRRGHNKHLQKMFSAAKQRDHACMCSPGCLGI